MRGGIETDTLGCSGGFTPQRATWTHGTWGHLKTVGLLPIVNVCFWAMEGELMNMRSSKHENISCFRVIRDVEEQGRASAAEAR